MRRIDGAVLVPSRFVFDSKPTATVTHGWYLQRRETLVGLAGLWVRSRLQATAALYSGCWLDALPKQVLNTHPSC